MKPLESLPEEWRPELRFTLPELQFPDEVNITEYILDPRVSAATPNKVAVYYGAERWTYAQLSSAVHRFASGLSDLGIRKGDVVMLRIPNRPEFMVCALALHRIGVVVVPTMVLLAQKTLTYIANSCGAKAVIVAAESLEALEAGLRHCETVKQVIVIGGDEGAARAKGYLPYVDLLAKEEVTVPAVRMPRDEMAFISFTSGTTGEPKGCMHQTVAPLAGAFVLSAMVDGVRPDDILGGTPPLAFVYGYGLMMMAPFKYGGAASLIPGRATPETVLEAIQRDRITVFAGTPTMYRMILDIPDVEKRYDLSSVRIFLTASAPTPLPTFHEWQQRFGHQLINAMGSNEAHTAFIGTWKDPIKLGSLGHPFPGYECAILDEEGNECLPGVVGKLAYRGPTGTMLWHNPDAQKKATMKGWSFTGDAAYQDEDGCFWHCSRTDDVIKSRGYRISPEEVENAVLEHPSVLEAGVIGVPDAVKGEAVKAYVMLRPGFAPSAELAEEIRGFTRERIAPYAAPSFLEFIDVLPRTDLLKLNRVALRQLAAGK